jgi:hypothetical protein
MRVERLGDGPERQPCGLAGADEGDPTQDGAGVPPLVPRCASRSDQPPPLVEPQRRRGHARSTGHLPNREFLWERRHTGTIPLDFKFT